MTELNKSEGTKALEKEIEDFIAQNKEGRGLANTKDEIRDLTNKLDWSLYADRINDDELLISNAKLSVNNNPLDRE